jgi:LysM repeat protein
MRWLSTSRRIQMSTIAFTPTTFTARSADAAVRPMPRLRITRRGRAVLGALLVAPLAIALAVSTLGSPPAEAGSTVATASFEHVTVAAGESLWELAAWIAPEADPRQVVSDLVALNQLSTTEVQPGQRLAIPLQYAE